MFLKASFSMRSSSVGTHEPATPLPAIKNISYSNVCPTKCSLLSSSWSRCDAVELSAIPEPHCYLFHIARSCRHRRTGDLCPWSRWWKSIRSKLSVAFILKTGQTKAQAARSRTTRPRIHRLNVLVGEALAGCRRSCTCRTSVPRATLAGLLEGSR